MAMLSELVGSRDLLANLTQRELRGKYRRSVLGWAWSLINPLALAAMFTVVFSVVFRAGVPTGHPSGLNSYPLFLLCGLLPWNFLSNGINGSIGSLVGNANLVKKVYFPREVLVTSSVLSWVVSLLIEMGVLGVVLLLMGNMILPWIPMVLLLIALQFLFVTGVGLALSVFNVYFRDVQHFMAIFLQLWFYASPIIYPISFIASHDRMIGPVHLLTLYKLNPMAGFATSYQALLYDLRFPSWVQLGYVTLVSVASLTAGLLIFRRLDRRLAEEL